jgi:outer membrane lipoprotein-sorting protein
MSAIFYSDESRPILTISNGQFTEIVNGHLEDSTIGEGTVLLSSRKLIFKYLDIPNQDSSQYSVKFAPIRIARDTAILHLRVTEKGTGPTMVNVWCVDSLNKVLSKSITDTAGYKYLSIAANKNISKVEIISLGYYIVHLPLSNFMDTHQMLTLS